MSVKRRWLSWGMACILSVTGVTIYAATEVEVLHYWTAGGEAKAVEELKRIMREKGIGWKDFTVAGGGGGNAMVAVRARSMAGYPPAAAQINGPSIQEWGDEGLLANINEAARKGNWDEKLPEVVSDIIKYKGRYVAAPVNLHRVNWLWINPDVFKRAGATVPTTWEEFFDAADNIRRAGFVAIAQGGQSWQEATIFETIVVSVGGAELYRKALVELDPDAMGSKDMIRALEIFKRIGSYVDTDSPERDWNVTTAMVMHGKAGMQFMGDWAKGEFSREGKVAGKDFLCVPVPGTSKSFLFGMDSITMFKVHDKEIRKAQLALAESVMSEEFQVAFNVNKGSIPVLPGVSREKFDLCAKTSMDAFNDSVASDTLLPSLAHNMALPSVLQGALVNVFSRYLNSDMTARQAVEEMKKAVQ